MTAITNKMTKSQLIAFVEELLGEKATLQQEKAELVDEIVGLKNKWQEQRDQKAELKLPGGNPNVSPVDDSKVVLTMRWVMNYVGLNVQATDDFLQEFEVYTNKEKNWLAVYPKKGLPNSGKFIKELAQARHAKGIQGNYWNNYGMWMNVPVK